MAPTRLSLRWSSPLTAVFVLAAALGAIRLLADNPARALSTTLNPEADASVDAGLPGQNFGTSTALQVLGGATPRRAFVRFDLAGVPAGSVINSATLRLYRATASAAATMEVRRVTGAWTEAALTHTASPAVHATVRATVSSPATPGGYDEFDVKTLVNDWVNLSGANPNQGVEVSATTAVVREYAAREAGANRPELVIDYTPPATTAAIPSTSATVTLDHICNSTEYAGALVFSYADLGGAPGTVSLVHNASTVYVCVSGPVGTEASRFFAVYLDPDNGREASAQVEDEAREVTVVGNARTSRVGDGTGGYTGAVTLSPDWAASAGTNASPAAEAAEFAIPLGSFPSPCAFGLAVYHSNVTAVGERYGWPSNVAYNQPSSWVTASLTGVPACVPTTTTTSTTTTTTTTVATTTTSTTTSTTSTTVPGGGAGSVFVPLQPDRLFDSRTGEPGPGPKGLVPPGGTVEVPVLGRSGVPATGVSALAMNVTAVDAINPGFVTVFPTGSGRPLASSLNIVPGPSLAVPNFVIVPVGADGKVSFFLSGGGHVLADVAGYFTPVTGPAAAGRFVPLNPARVFDSRAGEVAPGPKGFIAAGTSVSVTLSGVGAIPATGVSAVVLNVTATGAAAPGFLTAYPAGGQRPVASVLNLVRPGHTAANLVVIPLGSGGRIDLFASAGAHVLADVQGYFTDATASADTVGLFVPLAPGRIFDTRPNEPGGGLKGFVPADGTIGRVARGVAGIPDSGAGSVFLNVTATESGAPGFFTVYPAGRNQPLASNLNVTLAGETRANAAIIEIGQGGQHLYYTQSGAHLLADTSGYFRG